MSSKTGLQINSIRDCIKKPFMAVLFKNYLSAVQGTNSGVTHKCEFEIRPWSAARLLFKNNLLQKIRLIVSHLLNCQHVGILIRIWFFFLNLH